MSEGFHVCNRSRRHCPILVMSPEPNKPYFKYAQVSCEVRAKPTKSLPPYNHKL
jgi:hypothetical protein